VRGKIFSHGIAKEKNKAAET